MATLPSELDKSIFDASRFPHFSGVAGSSSSPMFVLHKNILKPSEASDDGHTGSASNVAQYPYNIAKGDFTEEAAGNLTSIVRVPVSPEYHSLQFWLAEIEQNSLIRTNEDDLAISIYGKHPIRDNHQRFSPNVNVSSTFEQVDHVWMPLRFPNPLSRTKATGGQIETGATDGSGAFEMYAYNFLYAGSWYPSSTTTQQSEGDGVRLKGGTFSTNTDIGMSFKCPQTVLLDGCSEVMMTVHNVMTYGNAPDAAFMMGRFLA